MSYSETLVIPAGTTRVSPATKVLNLAYGTINEVIIIIPAGQAGLTRIQMYYHESQAFPRNMGAYYSGDDTIITFPARYPIHSEPLELVLVGWAPSATLEHSIVVEVGLVEESLLAMSGFVVPVLPEGMGV